MDDLKQIFTTLNGAADYIQDSLSDAYKNINTYISSFPSEIKGLIASMLAALVGLAIIRWTT